MNTHIIPANETDLHEFKATCDCNTTITTNTEGEIVIIHEVIKPENRVNVVFKEDEV